MTYYVSLTDKRVVGHSCTLSVPISIHRGNNDTQSCHREARCTAMQAQVLQTNIKGRAERKKKNEKKLFRNDLKSEFQNVSLEPLIRENSFPHINVDNEFFLKSRFFLHETEKYWYLREKFLFSRI